MDNKTFLTKDLPSLSTLVFEEMEQIREELQLPHEDIFNGHLRPPLFAQRNEKGYTIEGNCTLRGELPKEYQDRTCQYKVEKGKPHHCDSCPVFKSYYKRNRE